MWIEGFILHEIAYISHLSSVRYNNLIQKFTELYGRKPDFVARSPGRVNLIGEHIDYCGFGVMPMAIERDCLIAVATTDQDTKVRIANVNPKYEAREFDFEGKDKIVTIDDTKHEWTNYFKCGYKVKRMSCHTRSIMLTKRVG